MTDRVNEFSHFNVHAKDVPVGAEDLWSRIREQQTLPRSDEFGGFRIRSRAALRLNAAG
jgi:hypothetical protein